MSSADHGSTPELEQRSGETSHRRTSSRLIESSRSDMLRTAQSTPTFRTTDLLLLKEGSILKTPFSALPSGGKQSRVTGSPATSPLLIPADFLARCPGRAR